MARERGKKMQKDAPPVKAKPGVYVPCEVCGCPTTKQPITNMADLDKAPTVCEKCNGKRA